jgi:hypothetical protein
VFKLLMMIMIIRQVDNYVDGLLVQEGIIRAMNSVSERICGWFVDRCLFF